jgi:hypothetical protein
MYLENAMILLEERNSIGAAEMTIQIVAMARTMAVIMRRTMAKTMTRKMI